MFFRPNDEFNSVALNLAINVRMLTAFTSIGSDVNAVHGTWIRSSFMNPLVRPIGKDKSFSITTMISTGCIAQLPSVFISKLFSTTSPPYLIR